MKDRLVLIEEFIDKNGKTVLVVNDVLNDNEKCYQVIAISGTRAVLAVGPRGRQQDPWNRPALKCVMMDILSGKVVYATDYGKRLSECGKGLFIDVCFFITLNVCHAFYVYPLKKLKCKGFIHIPHILI